MPEKDFSGSTEHRMQSAEQREKWFFAVFCVFLAGLSLTRITDYDFWWHLNLGRQVAQSASLQAADAFTYTFAGAGQFNGEWLADLLLYLAYAGGGFAGVAALKLALLALTFWFLLRACRELTGAGWTGLYASLLTLVLIAFAIRFRLFIRPFLFSYLFLALFSYLLAAYGRSRNARILWLLPLVELLWANTSKGFFYGPLLIGIFLLNDLFGRKLDRRLLWAGLGTLAISLASPEFYHPYLMFFDAAQGQAVGVVGEQQPLSRMMLWGFGLKYTWAFQVLALGGAVHLLLGGWRRPLPVLFFALFLPPALAMVRMIDFFSLAAVFFFLPTAERAAGWVCSRLEGRRRALELALPVALLLVTLAAVPGSRTYALGIGPEPRHLPAGALAFLDREGVAGRVFNSYPYGGYIAWASPKRPVFIDGRVNQLFPPEFHRRYFQILHEPGAWREEEGRWGFDVAVLEYDLQDQGLHFPKHLSDNAQWALVYWDGRSAVYLRRTPAHAAVIARYEHRVLRPAFYQFDYLQPLLRQYPAPELLRRIEAEANLSPDNQEARLAKVFVMYALGAARFQEQILQELRLCLKLEPDLALEHSALAMVLAERGMAEEAVRETKKALSLDPSDPAGLQLKQKLGI
jgi:hypothetical protein